MQTKLSFQSTSLTGHLNACNLFVCLSFSLNLLKFYLTKRNRIFLYFMLEQWWAINCLGGYFEKAGFTGGHAF